MTTSVVKRPRFDAVWKLGESIYRPKEGSTVLQHVAKTIGGRVWSNICKNAPSDDVCATPTDAERQTERFEGKWSNTCAVRMSYILNQTGVRIPKVPGNLTVTGADRHNYFYRVKDVIAFLRQQWGEPDVLIKNPPAHIETRNPDGTVTKGAFGGKLAGKKGVILFVVPDAWGDAEGHATLFNGARCYDDCYFNGDNHSVGHPWEHSGTTHAHFWELP
jgi:hypothetical protein